MKIKPEILLEKNNDIFYNKILVSGSDESLIGYVTQFLIKKFKEKNFHIDNTGTINNNLTGDLFTDKKILFLLKDYSLKKDLLKMFDSEDQSVLISIPNNKKISSLKSIFTKSKNSIVIDCYTLSRASKEMVIKNFIDKNNIQLSADVFWFILENFENDYVLLKNQLLSLSLYKTKIDLVSDVEKVIFLENKIEINKIFFYILNNNKTLIKVFNKNIYSQGDFYIFLNSLKLYLSILSTSQNKEGLLTKFPKYLFGEKDIIVKIHNRLDKSKILKIYSNLIKVESLVRKNSSLYFVIGLRFLLNTKKIITS